MNVTEKRKIEKLIVRQIDEARRELRVKFVEDVRALRPVVPSKLLKLVKELRLARAKKDEWTDKVTKINDAIRDTTPSTISAVGGYYGSQIEFESSERHFLERTIMGNAHNKNEDGLGVALANSEYPLAKQYSEDDKALINFQESELVAKIYLSGDSTALKMLEKLERTLTKLVAGF